MSNSKFKAPEQVTLVNDKGTRIHVSKALAPKMRGFRPAGQATALVGDPDESWTVAQLRTWADEHDVNLDGATKKADILEAIDLASEDDGEGQE
jgi:hypothetical protein